MEQRFRRMIEDYSAQSVRALQSSLTQHADLLIEIAAAWADSIRSGGKVLFFGNGGSAADAQHLAAELVNRYRINRDEIAGLALTTDTSVITSISNDFGYDLIFAKQIRALAKKGDVAYGISTSGASKNVLLGLEAARKIGCLTVGVCGLNPMEMKPFCDFVLTVDDPLTPIVQQVQIVYGHLLCDLVEQQLFGRSES